jgi:hypothetical protein
MMTFGKMDTVEIMWYSLLDEKPKETYIRRGTLELKSESHRPAKLQTMAEVN